MQRRGQDIVRLKRADADLGQAETVRRAVNHVSIK